MTNISDTIIKHKIIRFCCIPEQHCLFEINRYYTWTITPLSVMVKMKEKTISYYMFIPVFPADISACFIVSIHILIKIFKSMLRTIDKKSY